MTLDGGQRIATADGAMLADPAGLRNVAGFTLIDECLFDPAFWAARGELADVTRGRGSAWFVGAGPGQWALRHYRRGGFIARLSADRYVWTGESRVRAFAEWRLLAALVRRGLPVPEPMAARYSRGGLTYRCDLITRRIVGAVPLSVRLELGALREGTWREIGTTVARFHVAGVDHADLNAHNLLLDDAGGVSLIDFDRGRLRPHASTRAAAAADLAAAPESARSGSAAALGSAASPRTVVAPGSLGAPGSWAAGNIARLRRSLDKIARALPAGRFGAREWRWFLDGYVCACPL